MTAKIGVVESIETKIASPCPLLIRSRDLGGPMVTKKGSSVTLGKGGPGGGIRPVLACYKRKINRRRPDPRHRQKVRYLSASPTGFVRSLMRGQAHTSPRLSRGPEHLLLPASAKMSSCRPVAAGPCVQVAPMRRSGRAMPSPLKARCFRQAGGWGGGLTGRGCG